MMLFRRWIHTAHTQIKERERERILHNCPYLASDIANANAMFVAS